MIRNFLKKRDDNSSHGKCFKNIIILLMYTVIEILYECNKFPTTAVA